MPLPVTMGAPVAPAPPGPMSASGARYSADTMAKGAVASLADTGPPVAVNQYNWPPKMRSVSKSLRVVTPAMLASDVVVVLVEKPLMP